MRKTLNLDITIYQGANFSANILVPTGGLPQDITGYLFYGYIKESTAFNAAILAEFTFTILNQTTKKGQVSWLLNSEDSGSIPLSISGGENIGRLTTPYIYDVVMVDTSNVKTRILEGMANISPGVTIT